MALGKNYDRQNCSFARALELLGERWTLLLVRDAFYGVRRYADFLAHLDIPRAVLADRLRSLTEAGVLDRRRYSDAPPRDEYVLTDRGRELWSAFYQLGQWGERHLSSNGPIRLFVHADCDTALDPTGACGGCGRLVAPEEVEIRPGPGEVAVRRDDPVSVALRRPHRLLTPLIGEPEKAE
ncbi:winged helix-turn-helix transcriptional regulator [Plantactinospora sonchi]|uniref:Helix-turn-helix domain-containing protein n=1 Tax=Plantactinospora sonchi TaxID=1544735 RepID=A0ABU7S517_9ACTN